MNMQKCYLSMHRYKAFLKVAEVGSFTKAAELLGYTQPALSQMMTSLERELSIDPPIIRTLAVGHQGPPHPAAGGQGVYRRADGTQAADAVTLYSFSRQKYF